MTIEEKARAYDEALEDMRVIYPNLRGDAKLAAEHAFPELVENEDDRIKKIITDSVFYLYGAGDEYKDTLDYLDKLEKRKECLADNGKSASEDERIRRQMIRYFTEMKEGGSAAPPYDDCIAYLERRKETGIQWLKSDNVKNPDKPYIDKAGMFYTTDGRMCYASEIEKRKPAEWGELQSEFKNINEAFEDGKKEVAAHPERYGLCECVPAEWDEEDSDNLERVDNYLWMLDDYVGDDCAMPQGKAYNIRENIQEVLSPWLKSLPGRFNLQPRQEWGEEDRDTLLMAATVLKANFDSDEKFEDCDYDCGTLAGKLLEMRYRIGSSWKPSEEELRTLDIVITDYRHACTKGSDEKAETLKPLLEQLKKL